MSSVPVIVGGAAKDAVPSVIIGGVEKKIYDAYVIVGGAAKRVFTTGATVTSISSELTLDQYAIFSGTPSITVDSEGFHYILNWYHSKQGTSGSSESGVFWTYLEIDLGGTFSFAANALAWKIKSQITGTCSSNSQSQVYSSGSMYISKSGEKTAIAGVPAFVLTGNAVSGTLTVPVQTANLGATALITNKLRLIFYFVINSTRGEYGNGTITLDISNDAMSLLPSEGELPILFN